MAATTRGVHPQAGDAHKGALRTCGAAPGALLSPHLVWNHTVRLQPADNRMMTKWHCVASPICDHIIYAMCLPLEPGR